MNKNSKSIIGKIIYALQVLISLIAIALLLVLNYLPTKYLIVVIGILVMFLGLTAPILKGKDGNSRTGRKVLSLLLSAAMLFLSLYLYNFEKFSSNITGASKDTHTISIVVLDESPYQSVNDVEGEDFAANTRLDGEKMNKASALILAKYNTQINIVDYSDYQEMASDLYDGTVKVMLLGEAHRTFITDTDSEFESKTRIIGEISYEVDVEIEDKNTNVSSDTFSIFLSGIDTFGPVSSVSRSDVNMIMTINPNTHQILLTSIPRDYHVILPKFNQYDKLTHAGIYGAGESVAALENLLNIDIDYYAKVNFSSVTKIVDALGGVSVESQYAFTGPHGYQFSVGSNFVNGEQALSFVRERYSLPGGDNARVINQQSLVNGILNKAMSPSIITNINSVLASIDGTFEMSMPTDSFKKIIKTQVDSMASWEIISIQLTGTGAHSTTTASMPGWDLYVMEPDHNSVNIASTLIHQMENDEVIVKP